MIKDWLYLESEIRPTTFVRCLEFFDSSENFFSIFFCMSSIDFRYLDVKIMNIYNA